MANAISKTFVDIQTRYLPLFVFNPAKRFITPQDEINAINAAAIRYATRKGGIRTKDDTNVSVAGQRDYVIDTRHKAIVRAQYVQNLNQVNEVVTPLDQLDTKGVEFVSALSQPTPAAAFDNASPLLTGTPQPVPKFILFWSEISTLRLLDTPQNGGDTIRLYCLSLAEALSTGVTYSGSEEDLIAIAQMAAGILRMGKTRDTAEGKVLLDDAMAQADDARAFEAKKRRPRVLEDGRYVVTRLRSMNPSR